MNCLTDLPNIGPSIAADLRRIGVEYPTDLFGRDPYVMYADLSTVTGMQHDPCILDVFISITRFMGGEGAKPWYAFTSERKRIRLEATTGRRIIVDRYPQ